MQINDEFTVGLPYTTNMDEPFMITPPSNIVLTAIKYDVVIDAGVVLNTKLDPPLLLVNADAVPVACTVKSDARPVMAPLAPDTRIVHVIVRLARAGLVLVHDSCDADVGLPYTTNDGEPLVMVTPLV